MLNIFVLCESEGKKEREKRSKSFSFRRAHFQFDQLSEYLTEKEG